jgi:hypothetical protein
MPFQGMQKAMPPSSMGGQNGMQQNTGWPASTVPGMSLQSGMGMQSNMSQNLGMPQNMGMQSSIAQNMGMHQNMGMQSSLPQNMGMQQNIGMQQNMGMQQNLGMQNNNFGLSPVSGGGMSQPNMIQGFGIPGTEELFFKSNWR